MNLNRTKSFVILTLIGLLLFLADLAFGSVSIPLTDILQIFSGSFEGSNSWERIILDFRLPRAIAATLVGIGLATSGLQMQTLFRNPLSGPFVLGISSGASLGVAILLLAGATGASYFDTGVSSWLVVLAATIGALAVLFLVLIVSLRITDTMALLIIGLMFGSLTGALVSVLQYFSTGDEIQMYLFWTFGNLGGMNWTELTVLSAVIFAGLLLCVFIAKPLNTFLLSENYARNLGVNISRTRLLTILSTSLLAGGITAFCGPIAFIGLAVPHFARIFFNSADHRFLFPATALCGICIMLFCDLVSQLPGSEQVLPINAVTSLFGAPVVIWLILKRKSVSKSF